MFFRNALINQIHFFILQTDCRFSINNAVRSGNYAVALQIEDFKDSSSTVPLSSVPLQFIFTVGSSPSCSYHSYFVSPTPPDGDTLQSQNGSLQFIARAQVLSYAPAM